MDATIHPLTPRLQAVLYGLLRNIAEIEQYNTADLSVTVAQSYALLTFPPENNISMSDLSERLHLAKSTMTRMADQLVKRGLIERETDPQDRRAVYVRLTEAGQALRQQIEAEYADFLTKVLAEIAPDQQTPTLESLETLVNAIVTVLQRKHNP